MSDDKTKAGKADRDRISLSEDYEVRDAAEKYGVSIDTMRAAIEKAGPMRKDIEAELKR